MKFLRKLLGQDKEDRLAERSESRKRDIAALGFELIDRRGWVDGVYAPRRFFLHRNGEAVGGPYSSYNDTLTAARRLASEPANGVSADNEPVS